MNKKLRMRALSIMMLVVMCASLLAGCGDKKEETVERVGGYYNVEGYPICNDPIRIKVTGINDYLCEQVMQKSMAVCNYFRCPNIVVHGLKMRRYLGTEEAEWMQTEAMLDKIAPMAKEMGITICVENLYESISGHIVEGPCCDARKAAERIDRFNEKYHAPVLGFCFDTGHANLVGIDFEDFIVKLGDRLKVLHVHDNDGISDLHQIPFTFTKTRENSPSTDWEGFLSGLRSIGYNGVISFETAPVLASFPEEMKEDALKFIARIGTHFSDKIEKGK